MKIKSMYPLFISFMLASVPVTAVVDKKEVTESPSFSLFEKTQNTISSLSHDNPHVLKMSHTFLTELQNVCAAHEGLTETDFSRILDAVSFSAEKHQNQTRKDPENTPYIIHPIGVAYNLLTIGKVRDADVLIGALLHDTVEDTHTTFEEIGSRFGKRVEDLVREVTDDKSLPKMERKRLQIVHAPHKSAGAAEIKLGDKLYNLNDLLKNPPLDWPQERVDAYFQWATLVVDGLPSINAPLKKAVDDTITNYWGKDK